MAWPIVPLTYDDEWLGHWLLRLADRYGMTLTGLLHYIRGRDARRSSAKWTDVQFLNATHWLTLERATRRRTRELQTMQRILCPIAAAGEYGYCAQCCTDDERGGRPCYWRRTWADGWAVWCDHHDTGLESHVALAPTAYYRYGELRAYLNMRTDSRARGKMPTLTGQRWWQALRDETRELRAAALSLSQERASVLVNVGEAMLSAFLKNLRDPDAVSALLPCIECSWPDQLDLRRLMSQSMNTEASVGRIRAFAQRVWVLGVVCVLLGRNDHGSGVEHAERCAELRNWLWRFLPAFHAPKLVHAVRLASAAHVIAPWAAVEHWHSPLAHRDWFSGASGAS